MYNACDFHELYLDVKTGTLTDFLYLSRKPLSALIDNLLTNDVPRASTQQRFDGKPSSGSRSSFALDRNEICLPQNTGRVEL